MELIPQRADHARKSRVPPSISTELIDLREMECYRDHWADLALNTIEPNYFYCPVPAMAAARHLDPDLDLKALLVWEHSGGNDEWLIGLFPFSISRARWGIPVKLYMGWINNFSASSAPLLRDGMEDLAVLAFLEWLDECEQAPRACMMCEIAFDGPAMGALKRGLRATNRPFAFTRYWHRAVLESDLEPEDYMVKKIGRSTRQGLKRKSRRLSELGDVRFEIFEGDQKTEQELEQALEDFIKLEASGWKGEAGTALKLNPNALAYAREAYTHISDEARTRIDVLSLDNKPVSISITCVAGQTAWYLKPTYDEELGRYSPGMLAQLEHLKAVLDTPDLKELDSACVPGHIIEKIWTDKKEVGDILFAARSNENPRLIAALSHAEETRHKIRDALKSTRDFVKSKLK